MKFKFEVKQSHPLDQLIEELPKRFDLIAKHLGRVIAEKAAAQVKALIPNKAGWYQTYRNAVGAFESGDKMVVAAQATITMPVEPSETSLLNFDSSTEIAKVLNPYNPWPIDLIPPIQGGYDLDVVVSAASAATVSAERVRLRSLLPLITQALTDAGASVLGDSQPVMIKGKLYTDIVFLAKLLETGADGFPKKPHWRPGGLLVEKLGVQWGKSQEDIVEQILQGIPASTPLPGISASLMNEIEDKLSS